MSSRTIRTIARLRTFRIPPRNGVAQGDEYGRAEHGVALCVSCGNIHYRKQWLQPRSVNMRELNRRGTPTTRTLCPACSLGTRGLYEGELLLENVPLLIEEEVGRLIRGFGRRAQAHNPQHRIIAIKRERRHWRVTTTENQLAVRLAKKIQDSFKRVLLTISHSREPYEVGRVRLVFS